MTITLSIDNVDALPDGGPIRYQANRHGFEVGREQHLDWTLPDPARYISGRHCEFRYENGAYWLYDVSRNGTFVNGSATRVKSPYKLAHGDRLAIGHYIIRVEIEGAEGEERQEAPAEPVETPVYAPSGGDVWDIGGPTPPPADRRDFMPAPARRAPDFSDEFLNFPDVRPPEPPPHAGSGPRAESPFAPPAGGVSESPFGPGPSVPGEGFGGPGAAPFVDPPAPHATPFPESPPAAFPPPPTRPTPQGAPPRPAFQPGSSASPAAFIEAIARGAGVPAEVFLGRDPQEVAVEIGEVLRATTENLAQLLKARAAAKTMTKSSDRTMITAADNNPLKFVPVASEAIEIMFRRNRAGYMGARQSVEESFADLKRHELATYAAMQKALALLLDEFSPETIEAKAASSTFAMKKSRSWDLFVARWEEKSANPNGMLDTFLAYFAEAYDEANRKK